MRVLEERESIGGGRSFSLRSESVGRDSVGSGRVVLFEMEELCFLKWESCAFRSGRVVLFEVEELRFFEVEELSFLKWTS